ncbi:hypothetical protein GOP47_0024193, partial [Adiantum capillus-veneris]
HEGRGEGREYFLKHSIQRAFKHHCSVVHTSSLYLEFLDMEATRRAMCAMLLMGLIFNILGSVEASCTVKNSSGKDIVFVPVSATNVKIKVKVGAVVEIPSIYLNVIIKNLGNGKSSSPVKLVDGTVLVCVNGAIKGTISIYVGGLLNGIISIISSTAIIVSL